MKIAIIGSRKITNVALEKYIPENTTEIVSGGAIGVDCCASDYARKRNIKLTEITPQYSIYGRAAPIVRNKEIVNYSDRVIAFWDGSSKGTLSVIKYARKTEKPCEIIIISETAIKNGE